MNEVKEQADKPGQGPSAVQVAARDAVRGALEELNSPERQAAIGRAAGAATQGALGAITGQLPNSPAWGGGPPGADRVPIGAMGDRLSEGFTLGMSRQLQLEIGPNADGPLAKSLSALAQQLSAAALTGVTQQAVPNVDECNGPDRSRCTERRVEELSRAASRGFLTGLGVVGMPLVTVFLAGVLAGVLVLISIRTFRRRAPN